MSKMALDSIEQHYTTEPPRIVIYGPHGIGKTTFGASAPNAVILPIEKGLAGIRAKKFPRATSYADVISAINTLLTSEHNFGALVVDTLDWLEPLVWEHTAFMGQVTDIEAFGYGKGYKKADEYWRTILDGLTALQEQRGMVVICVAHAIVKKFDAPDTDAYDRYQIKLHERAAALVAEWADVIGFAHLETVTVTKGKGFDASTKGQTSGNRILSVEERPAFQAKNRYGMPAEILFPKTGAWDLFAAAVAGAYEVPPPRELPPAELGVHAGEQPTADEQLIAEENARALDDDRELDTLADGAFAHAGAPEHDDQIAAEFDAGAPAPVGA